MITLVGRDDFGKEIRFTLSQIKSLGWSKRSMCIQADEYEVIDPETVECANCAGLREQLSDYEEAARSRDNLVRQLDVIWNGEAGAAKQARLCDIVSQLESEVPKLREQVKLLREALYLSGDMLSDFLRSMPTYTEEGWGYERFDQDGEYCGFERINPDHVIQMFHELAINVQSNLYAALEQTKPKDGE